MQLPEHIASDSIQRKWFTRGMACLLMLVVFFVGQAVTQLGVSAPYSAKNQSISSLGITACGNFKEPQPKQWFYVCSPLHIVMDATFVLCGALIMLATTLALRPLWPGGRLRKAGLALLFFGGIEEIVAGFSPLNLNLFLHSLSGGLAISALNVGLVLLGFAAIKKQPGLGWFTLGWGAVGIVGSIMDGKPPYAGLGYGGWERVAGFAFPVWGICLGVYWLLQLRQHTHHTTS
ncbi:MAG TPA: hypothetical protein VLG92_04720 [Candidatus Saccharimonadia bacterium]|nr:hypothetical protein [Candidatus Saccharimonadia bacterium]